MEGGFGARKGGRAGVGMVGGRGGVMHGEDDNRDVDLGFGVR